MTSLKDISLAVLSFREAVRHNWNSYFQGIDDSMGPEIQDAFSLVEEGLFQALVMSACNFPPNVRYRIQPLPFLLVGPRSELPSLSLQIGAPENGSVAWEIPVIYKIDRDSKLEFIRFFDWNPYEQISMTLVQVRITRLDSHPELVGSTALVAEHEVRFLLVQDEPLRA